MPLRLREPRAPLTTETTFDLGGAWEALLVLPDSAKAAGGVLVNHGNPGVPRYLRALAARLAEDGRAVLVVAGDGRVEPRAVSEVPEAERAAWRTLAFAERYLDATRRAFDRLCDLLGAGRPVALVGLCGGGWQAVTLAAEGLPVDRVVALHAATRFRAGDPRHDLVEALPGVTVPVQFHFGALDELTPAADIAELRDVIERHALLAEVFVWGGAGHGFLDPERPDAHDGAAAAGAIARLCAFLRGDDAL